MKNHKNFRESTGKLKSYLKRNSVHKECFYKGCDKKPIKSHSIQNNKILNRISEEGDVLKIDTDHSNAKSRFILKREGRGTASTFRGFCKDHDKNIFKDIEDDDYQIGNKKQEFLFAYRALAKKYFSIKSINNMAEHLLELSDNEYQELCDYCDIEIRDRDYISQTFENVIIDTEDHLKSLENYKIMMNTNLEKERYYKIKSKTFMLPNIHKITASSFFFPEYDNKGNKIYDFNLFNNLKPLFLTIFPQNTRTYIIISYLKTDKNYFDFIKSQIIEKKLEFKKKIMSNIIAVYVENFFISPTVWNNIDERVQNEFIDLFTNYKDYKTDKLLINHNINLFIWWNFKEIILIYRGGIFDNENS